MRTEAASRLRRQRRPSPICTTTVHPVRTTRMWMPGVNPSSLRRAANRLEPRTSRMVASWPLDRLEREPARKGAVEETDVRDLNLGRRLINATLGSSAPLCSTNRQAVWLAKQMTCTPKIHCFYRESTGKSTTLFSINPFNSRQLRWNISAFPRYGVRHTIFKFGIPYNWLL